MTALGHIHLGVIQRSRGKTALARLAYQRCAAFSDEFGRHADYRGDAEWHRGTVVLIPPGGAPDYADPEEFLPAAIHQERRRDAQEGRTIDFALPRGVPAGLETAVGAWVLAPLAAMGMAIELDAECPPASDGLPHPHIHAYVAQRELTLAGFGNKQRAWDLLFRKKRGRFLRHMIASRISAACQLLGLAVHVDPRPKKEWSDAPPEDRLAATLWRRHSRGLWTGPIEELKARRASANKGRKAASMERGGDRRADILIGDPADYHVGLRERATRIDAFCDHFRDAGFDPAGYVESGLDIAVVTTFGGQITYDGESLVSRDLIDVGELSKTIIDFARSLGWSSFAVEGDDLFSDALAVAGAPHGLVPINRSPSKAVLNASADPSGAALWREIAPFDLRAVVFNQIETRLRTFAETPIVAQADGAGAGADLPFTLEDLPTPNSVSAPAAGRASGPDQEAPEKVQASDIADDALGDFLALIESLGDPQLWRGDEAEVPEPETLQYSERIDSFPTPDWGFPDPKPGGDRMRVGAGSKQAAFTGGSAVGHTEHKSTGR